MTSGTYRTQLRTITFLSAGAALLAVIGFFLLKSDRKKTKKKSSDNEKKENNLTFSQKKTCQEVEEKIIQNNQDIKISEEDHVVPANQSQSQELEPGPELKMNSKPELRPDSEQDPDLYSGIKLNLEPKLVLRPSSESKVNFESDSVTNKLSFETELEQTLEPEPTETSSIKKIDEIININISSNDIESKTYDYDPEMVEKMSQNNNYFESSKNNECLKNDVNDLSSSPVFSNSSKDEDVDSNKATSEKNLIDTEESDMKTLSNPSSSSHILSQDENDVSSDNLTIEKDEISEEKCKVFAPNKLNNEIDTRKNLLPYEAFNEKKDSSDKEITLNFSNSTSNNNMNNASSNKKRNNSKRSRDSTSVSSVNSSISSNTKNGSSKSSKRNNNTLKNSLPNDSNKFKSINKLDDQDEYDNQSDVEDLVVYEFNFPRKLCGKLIGKNGVHVDYIRSKTQTQIAVRNDNKINDLQVVCVSGRISDVDKALDIIGHRFPSKLYPQISFKPISKPIVYRRFNKDKSNTPEVASKILVTSTNFVEFSDPAKSGTDEPMAVQITAIVNAGHVFVQLPKNSTYEELQQLDKNMLAAYDSMTELVPNMNEPIEYGTICAAPTSYGWHRAMITNYRSYEEVKLQVPDYNELCGLATVKFLDYGGYLNIPVNQLRQLRSDFMLLPFQGIECFLDGCWSTNQSLIEEGKIFLSQQIKDSLTEALVTGYSEDGIPFIKLYITNNLVQNYCINDVLDKHGFVINYKSKSNNLDSNDTSNCNQNVQNLFNNDSRNIVNQNAE